MGLFKAQFNNCLNKGFEASELIVEYPYSIGESVVLGSGIDAFLINIQTAENDTIPVLIYIQDNQLFWSWGFDNTNLAYSIFGMYYLDMAVWGGFPLYLSQKDAIFYPIRENFLELEKPHSINFNQYLERI